MKTTLGVIVFAAALTACSAVETVHETRLDPSPGTAYYCMRGRLFESDGDLVCNWHSNLRGACSYEYRPVRLAKNSLALLPDRGGQCNNGESLVQVTVKK
jgi:hypothetical protein